MTTDLKSIPSTKKKKSTSTKKKSVRDVLRGTISVKKLSISKLQKLLWIECKRIIRARYKHKCYTCGKPVAGSNMQTGHFIPKGTCGANLKYSLDNLRLQCYSCNINYGGQGAIFYKNMVQEKGQEFVDNLFREKQKTVKAYDYYLVLLDQYRKIKK